MSELNARELATILAALRKWQWSIRIPEEGRTRPTDAELGSLATNDDSFPPLTPAEIDELCEQLNGEGGEPGHQTPAVREALQNVLHYNWADEKEDARDYLRENGHLTGHVFADLVALDNWLHGTEHTAESYLTGEDDTADPGRPPDIPDGACIRVEYDLHHTGRDYDPSGQFAYVPCELIGRLGSVEEAFRQHTGYDPVHIVHYNPDEPYTADGESVQG